MPELFIFALACGSIFGLPIITGLFARSMGRRFWIWFFIGCLLPLIGAVIIFFLPDLKKIEEKKISS